MQEGKYDCLAMVDLFSLQNAFMGFKLKTTAAATTDDTIRGRQKKSTRTRKAKYKIPVWVT